MADQLDERWLNAWKGGSDDEPRATIVLPDNGRVEHDEGERDVRIGPGRLRIEPVGATDDEQEE